MTAYQMLHRAAKAKPAETVLVHGAAGRVGTVVLELATAAGLRVYGTASAGRVRSPVSGGRRPSDQTIKRHKELRHNAIQCFRESAGE